MPVANVTWSEAAAFAAWAGCTLPTEEQWECACRGPSGQLYPWGDTSAPADAVLGFGPAPVGSAQGDRSPFGCMDMAGSVAEWTATVLESQQPHRRFSPTAMPAKSRFYTVKGSSWAGMEEGRPTRVVAVPLPEGATDVPTLLTADSKTPQWLVRYRSNLEMEYLGVVGTEDYAYVLVRKWMPGWYQWAEWGFQATPDREIGGVVTVTVEEAPKPRVEESSRPRSEQGTRFRRGAKPRVEESPKPPQKEKVDLSTGCFAAKHEIKAWLDVRDPSGVIHRLLLVSGARSGKINECKDSPPAAETTLECAVSAAARMAGRENARYINVGFRCAKALWPLTSPAEASKAPAK